jgi:carboxypeptidase C (cathepsin A)
MSIVGHRSVPTVLSRMHPVQKTAQYMTANFGTTNELEQTQFRHAEITPTPSVRFIQQKQITKRHKTKETKEIKKIEEIKETNETKETKEIKKIEENKTETKTETETETKTEVDKKTDGTEVANKIETIEAIKTINEADEDEVDEHKKYDEYNKIEDINRNDIHQTKLDDSTDTFSQNTSDKSLDKQPDKPREYVSVESSCVFLCHQVWPWHESEKNYY